MEKNVREGRWAWGWGFGCVVTERRREGWREGGWVGDGGTLDSLQWPSRDPRPFHCSSASMYYYQCIIHVRVLEMRLCYDSVVVVEFPHHV